MTLRLPKRTVILGVITLVAGLALTIAVNLMPPVEVQEPKPASEPRSWFCLGAPLLLFGLDRIIAQRRYRKWVKPLLEGDRALAAGRVVQALALYTQSSEQARGQPIPRFNVGFARLCLWQLAAARLDLEASLTLRPWGTDSDANVLEAGAAALALVDALQGNLTHARLRLDALDPTSGSGIQTLAAVVIACREGRWPEARALARRAEVLALGGSLGALGRTLDCWSASEQGEPLERIDLVALFSEAAPNELYATWPELRAHLEEA